MSDAACVPLEHLRPFSHYADKLPASRGTRVHPATLGRWAGKGIRKPDGTRVKLRAVRIGAKWFTTDEWFAAFVADLTAAYHPAAGESPVRSPADRRRASDAAARRLDALGV